MVFSIRMIDRAWLLNPWIPASVRWLVNGRKLHSCVWKWCRTNGLWWVWRLNGWRESTQDQHGYSMDVFTKQRKKGMSLQDWPNYHVELMLLRLKMLTRLAASLLSIPLIMLKVMKRYYKYCHSLQSERLFVFWSSFLIPCISFIEQPWYVKEIVPKIDDSQHW